MSVECPEKCGYSAPNSHLYNLRRHLSSIHQYDDSRMEQFEIQRREALGKREKTFACIACDKLFTSKSNLNKHFKKQHQMEDAAPVPSEDAEENVDGGMEEREGRVEDLNGEIEGECETREQADCSESESGSDSEGGDLPIGIVCPIQGCQETVKSRRLLSVHCSDFHPDPADPSRFDIHFASVDSFTAFEDQMEKLEEETVSNFTRETYRKTDTHYVYYYYCSRANRMRNRGKNSRAEWRHAVQRHCSSFLIAKRDRESGEVTYEYCTGHVGHSLDPGQLRMSDRLVREIKHYILQDLTTQWILKEIKTKAKSHTRRRWIDEKDVENIRTRIGAQPWKRAKNDVESARRMAEENPEWGIVIHEEEEGPLRISIMTEKMKEWIRKFGHRAICMDDTYNFKLLILSVVDDVDRCLPVGFLFTCHMTSSDVSVLLQRVKQEVGEISPAILMTDDTMVFWNALILVFPSCEHNTQKLLCMFHVIQSVKRQAPQKISDKEKVKRVVAAFRGLTKEPSAPRFVGSLMSLLEWLKAERENDFLSYLRTHYLGEERIKQWAPYFRQGCPLNVNMGLERINEQLKNSNLKRRAGNSRLDHSIFQCIQLSLQIEERNLTADMRHKVGGRRRLLMTHTRHQSAIDDYSKEGVEQLNRNQWRINSKTDKNRKYITEKKFDCPCKTSINNHCSRCLACPYVWVCSCPDATKSGVCCVHVHAAIMYTEVDKVMEERLQTITDSIAVTPEGEDIDNPPTQPPIESRNEDPSHFDPLDMEMENGGENSGENGRKRRGDDQPEIFDLIIVPDGDAAAEEAIHRDDREKERRGRLEKIQSIQQSTLRRFEREGNEEEADLFLARLEATMEEFSSMGWNAPMEREERRTGRPCNAPPIRQYNLPTRASTKREKKKNEIPPKPITFDRLRRGVLCCICKGETTPTFGVKRKKGDEEEARDPALERLIWCDTCKNHAHHHCVMTSRGNLERCVVCNSQYKK